MRGCVLLFFFCAAAAVVPGAWASDELCCIGDYNMRGADDGFYWFSLNLKMDGARVEKLSWETSYACDTIPSGQECRIDTSGFRQSLLKDATIELKDPESNCVMRLRPQKKERGSYLLEADGCRDRFCAAHGVLLPIAIRMKGKKCLASPVKSKQ